MFGVNTVWFMKVVTVGIPKWDSGESLRAPNHAEQRNSKDNEP